jgi:hypothetical protein
MPSSISLHLSLGHYFDSTLIENDDVAENFFCHCSESFFTVSSIPLRARQNLNILAEDEKTACAGGHGVRSTWRGIATK